MDCVAHSGSVFGFIVIRKGRLRNFARAAKFRRGLRIFTTLCYGFWPTTSEDHNFLVRTPFWEFLNFMESPWSQESNHVSVEGNWCSQLCRKLMLYQVCRLLGCVDVRSYVLTWPLHGMA